VVDAVLLGGLEVVGCSSFEELSNDIILIDRAGAGAGFEGAAEGGGVG
jgi:hypothetical protein